jgi:hypothetical protein
MSPRVRSGWRPLQHLQLLTVALLLAVGMALGACGGEDELKRQDYDSVIAPERCGGSGGGPC